MKSAAALCIIGMFNLAVPCGAATKSIDIAPVWAGHPVGFALLTHGDRQFVAFYDAQRQMTVGARELDSETWHLVRLPEKLGWDSHNYVTMDVDRDGVVHLSGNMHGVPLVYFRTQRPLDIDTFERLSMLGEREQRVTYPRFFRGPHEELIFTYRDGGSGNGDQLYNVYDPDTRTWRRLVNGPLISGEGETNAYIQGPTRGPDGVYHMAWVWRDTPDCATNHDLSYARSRDLLHWETSDGKPLTLPITIKTAEIVDPVPAKGGLLNSNVQLAVDPQGRPVISYHKYESGGGPLQVYNARREAQGWRIIRASDWTWRYVFSGGGSIGAQVRVYPVEFRPDGLLQRYQNARHGSGVWRLNPQTLAPLLTGAAKDRSSEDRAGIREAQPSISPAIVSTQPALMVRTAGDLGRGPEPGVTYRLEWQTLPPNRDRPREGPPPPPTMLRLVVSHAQ